MPTGVSDLCYDVCECISCYLSDSDLSALRAFNHAFDDLSMLRRYRDVVLSVYWFVNETGEGEFEGFSLKSRPFLFHDPDEFVIKKARYVRSLQLVFRGGTDENTPGLIGLQGQTLQTPTWLMQITNFLSRLKQLEALAIILDWSHSTLVSTPFSGFFGSTLQPLFSPSLLAFGGNLRSLTVSIPREVWAYVFDPSLHLEKLEKLNIHFDKTYQVTQVESTIHTLFLVPFVQRHSQTLHALKLIRPHTVFYANFQYLPSIRTVEIEENFAGSSSAHSRFHRFLRSQRKTITRITWRISDDPQPCLGHPWFDAFHHSQIHLPNLRVLELENLNYLQLHLPTMQSFKHLPTFLRNYRRTLTKLCLGGWYLEFGLFKNILDAIGSPSQLKHLEICLQYLFSSIFSLMAKRLPYLHTLRISYEKLAGEHDVPKLSENANDNGGVDRPDPPPHDPTIFIHDMGKRYPHPQWDVRELYLDPADKRMNTWNINCVVARRLPSLFFINDIPVEEYV